MTKAMDCHARINLTAADDGVDIMLESIGVESNPAVRFAKFLCENSQALVMLANGQEAEHKFLSGVINNAIPRTEATEMETAMSVIEIIADQ